MSLKDIELAIFATGAAAVTLGIASAEIFNYGIALPVGPLLLIIAVILGTVNLVRGKGTPGAAWLLLTAELACAVTAILFLTGAVMF